MSLGHGASVVRDGLVFHMDMGNVNKSWKGKPTTNLTTNTPTQAGWQGSYSLINSNTKTFEVTTQLNNSSNGSAWRTWYWDVSSYVGSTITISGDVEFVEANNAEFLHVTIGQGNTGAYPVHIAGSDAADKVQVSTRPDQKIHMTWTGTINSAGLVGFTQWINNVTVDGGNVTLRISNVQIEVNGFETPFVNGTRSNTESIIDLTKNNTITVNNLSFNSDQTFEFDGTDDYISTFNTEDLFIDNQSWTISTFVNVVSNTTSGNGNGGIFGNQKYFTETDPGGFGLSIQSKTNFVGMLTHDDGAGTTTSYQSLAPMSINFGNYEEITYVYDSNLGRMTAYRNGIQKNQANNPSYKWSVTNRNSKIGTSTQGGWGYYFNMKIDDLKVYNRALTATEVKRNFNAIRGRYGI